MNPSLLLLLLLESPFSDPEDWKEKNSLATSSDTGSAVYNSYSEYYLVFFADGDLRISLVPHEVVPGHCPPYNLDSVLGGCYIYKVTGTAIDKAFFLLQLLCVLQLPRFQDLKPDLKPDYVYLVLTGSIPDEILESLIALPDLTALRDFYFQPFPEHLRLPLAENVYNWLPLNRSQIFKPDVNDFSTLLSSFAYDILNNVLAQGREETFHYTYAALIAESEQYLRELLESVEARQCPRIWPWLRLIEGRGRRGRNRGNPAEELVDKDDGDSIPYVPAHYARAFVLVHKLEAICQSSSVPPIKRMESRWSGKTLRVLLQQSGEYALVCLHSRNIMYRDLRLPNIVKMSDGIWWIVEFDDAAMSPSDGADYLELSVPKICGKHDCKAHSFRMFDAHQPFEGRTRRFICVDFGCGLLFANLGSTLAASRNLVILSMCHQHMGSMKSQMGTMALGYMAQVQVQLFAIWLDRLASVSTRREIQAKSQTIGEGFWSFYR
ncbi:hypothetical protein SELMODRAFT_420902 [Selaginella moellendorffii]|uniref:Protein kinase domain-containing protein n=1 Tax=Selaginella moellendorffii TaxID=88036 RepID=D8SDH4_SELML|nr:hypothetical protein SELMODRAFT_420902 [Selaginella moellendorffii]